MAAHSRALPATLSHAGCTSRCLTLAAPMPRRLGLVVLSLVVPALGTVLPLASTLVTLSRCYVTDALPLFVLTLLTLVLLVTFPLSLPPRWLHSLVLTLIHSSAYFNTT